MKQPGNVGLAGAVEGKIYPFTPAVVDIANFLAQEHSQGKSYSTLNSYGSA